MTGNLSLSTKTRRTYLSTAMGHQSIAVITAPSRITAQRVRLLTTLQRQTRIIRTTMAGFMCRLRLTTHRASPKTLWCVSGRRKRFTTSAWARWSIIEKRARRSGIRPNGMMPIRRVQSSIMLNCTVAANPMCLTCLRRLSCRRRLHTRATLYLRNLTLLR